MPNIKSAIKRVKVNSTKATRNQAVKSSLKTTLKKFDVALESGDVESANEVYKTAVKKIDQSVAKGVLHKNTGSRKKSQLAKKINCISA